MAIELVIDPYCENCPEFEAKVERETWETFETFDGHRSRRTKTFVTCVHRDRCRCVKEYIERGEKI